MQRTVMRILTLLSLLMLLASAGLCAYGLWNPQIAVHTSPGKEFGIGVFDGWALLGWAEFDDPNRLRTIQSGWEYHSYSTQDLDELDQRQMMTVYSLPGLRAHRMDTSGAVSYSGWIFAVHLAWPIVFCSILPVCWLFSRRNSPRRRAKLGLCIKCGYDLRGSTTGICPECGSPAATPATAVASHASEREGTSA